MDPRAIMDRVGAALRGGGPRGRVRLADADLDRWLFLLGRGLRGGGGWARGRDHAVVAPSRAHAERVHGALAGARPPGGAHLLLAPGGSPYSRALPSEAAPLRLFHACRRLAMARAPRLLVTTPETLLLRIPPPSFFRGRGLVLRVGDRLPPGDLARRLAGLGYVHDPSAARPGAFFAKGEVLDVHAVGGGPVRVRYFDDTVEALDAFDPGTGRSVPGGRRESLSAGPAPGALLLGEGALENLGRALPRPGPGDAAGRGWRRGVLAAVRDGGPLEELPRLFPLLLGESSLPLALLGPDAVVHAGSLAAVGEAQAAFLGGLEEDHARARGDPGDPRLLPSPRALYGDGRPQEGLPAVEAAGGGPGLALGVGPVSLALGPLPRGGGRPARAAAAVLGGFRDAGEVVVLHSGPEALGAARALAEGSGLAERLGGRLSFEPHPLERGFYWAEGHALVLTDAELLPARRPPPPPPPPPGADLFAERFARLEEGDHVIHARFGRGRYLGLVEMDAGGVSGDMLAIEYRGGDRIYVPVHGLDLVQKHGGGGTDGRLDSLRTRSFLRTRARARASAKELAFDLMGLTARREAGGGFAFGPPCGDFREFERAFPFEETPDQARAVEDVLGDMQRDRPMDRLVCGDVGFGKTEVAMRAAYKAVLDGKQVAVVVPTTLLALQHGTTFRARFQGLPVEVASLSRLEGAEEARRTREGLARGTVDVVVGTHRLLSPSTRFRDLGLVVIDEEQSFGVAQKERLKLLRSSVDVLTLTATPIPRTLQMALLGIRDLSLIRTSPRGRRAVETSVSRDDPDAVRKALRREAARGGQSFVIHNRVRSIEDCALRIQGLAPELRVTFVHGRMGERELTRRMGAFYRGEVDVLVSTTIVEAGLDVPNANTMIVERADAHGLAALHQLRGRIGRADRKARCLFIVPDRAPTAEAARRIEALQAYSDLGAGLALASADLDIRGAGDVLGAEQSGHVDSVGLELYTELLREAVAELKGEAPPVRTDVEVKTPFPSLIPKAYVPDPSLRLKYYKRLTGCRSPGDFDEIEEEARDALGPPPPPFSNLVKTLRIKTALSALGARSVSIGGASMRIAFDHAALGAAGGSGDALLAALRGDPGLFRVEPDGSVLCSRGSPWTPDSALEAVLGLHKEALGAAGTNP